MTDVDPFTAVPAPLAAAMRDRGFTQLTKIQAAVLDQEQAGVNLRMSSETGSGKTIAIGLVLADALLTAETSKRKGPAALLITPTRELAMQVAGELTWLFEKVRGVQVEVVTGGVDIRGDRRRLSARPQILVATPGRLLDHIRTGAVDCSDVAHVVLDEADQLLEMGFRDELDAIVAELPSERRSHLVSATFPRAVKDLAKRFQGESIQLQGTSLGAPNQDIETTAYLVSPHNTYAALVNVLLLAHGRRCLVFVQRRVDAAELSSKLAGDGFSALPFSGDLSQAQRTRTLDAFRHGIVNTLISTDVAARGIDVPDIATVIHADLPKDAANYTHRSGRTGRAGRKGASILLVPHRAERRIQMLLREAKVDASWSPPPSPKSVTKAIAKRLRRELHSRLAETAALEAAAAEAAQAAEVAAAAEAAEGTEEGTELAEGTEPTIEASKPKPPEPVDTSELEYEPITPADLEYAGKLLADHDPKHVVATLLAMAMPELPREPMGPEPAPRDFGRDRDRGADRGFDRGGSDRGGSDRSGGFDRGPRPERPPRTRANNRDVTFVPFEINWGEHAGATPGRLLAHVCRRGGITSSSIGAVRVGRRSSTFEVAQDVAEDFAAKAGKPDSRDPKLHVRRLSSEPTAI